jgi:hypothetical protein
LTELLILHVQKCVVVATSHRNPGSIVRDHITRTVHWSNNLCCDENDIDQLAEEHETQRAKLRQSNSRVAQVETVNPKHAEENGQQQGRVEVVTITGEEVVRLKREVIVKQYSTHVHLQGISLVKLEFFVSEQTISSTAMHWTRALLSLVQPRS